MTFYECIRLDAEIFREIKKMITAGFDVGTRFVKACIVQDTRPLGFAIQEVARDIDHVLAKTYKEALTIAHVKKRHIKKTVATGYGSKLVKKAAFSMSGSYCVTRAAYTLDNRVRTVVDAGALFINIAGISRDGAFDGEITNDKCAAGSGKFLEMIAQALEIPFSSISEYASKATEPYVISSNCAVFAESEVISQVNAGRKNTDIAAGVVNSIASRAATLFERIQAKDSVALVGGLALVDAFVAMFEELTGQKTITLPMPPQVIAAYGAALMAQGGKLRPRRSL